MADVLVGLVGDFVGRRLLGELKKLTRFVGIGGLPPVPGYFLRRTSSAIAAEAAKRAHTSAFTNIFTSTTSF